MSDCLFCRVIQGEIPATKVFEDEDVLAFVDINPQAPTHDLVIPKKHIEKVADIEEGDEALVGKMIRTAKDLAVKKGLEDFRIVINNGAGAGQTVFHLHLHLLAGRRMKWPPG